MSSPDKVCFPVTDSIARFSTLVEMRAFSVALYSQKCNEREEEKRSRDSNDKTREGASKGPEWRGYDGCFPEKIIQRDVSITPSLCMRRSKGTASSSKD
jgi:hypothetical protein